MHIIVSVILCLYSLLKHIIKNKKQKINNNNDNNNNNNDDDSEN